MSAQCNFYLSLSNSMKWYGSFRKYVLKTFHKTLMGKHFISFFMLVYKPLETLNILKWYQRSHFTIKQKENPLRFKIQTISTLYLYSLQPIPQGELGRKLLEHKLPNTTYLVQRGRHINTSGSQLTVGLRQKDPTMVLLKAYGRLRKNVVN